MTLRYVPSDARDIVLSGSATGRDCRWAPGIERSDLLDAVFKADLVASAAQSPQLAERYKE